MNWRFWKSRRRNSWFWFGNWYWDWNWSRLPIMFDVRNFFSWEGLWLLLALPYSWSIFSLFSISFSNSTIYVSYSFKGNYTSRTHFLNGTTCVTYHTYAGTVLTDVGTQRLSLFALLAHLRALRWIYVNIICQGNHSANYDIFTSHETHKRSQNTRIWLAGNTVIRW